MQKKKSIGKRIFSLVTIIIGIIVIYIVYRNYNYNDFEKNVSEVGITKFTRDNKIKCSKQSSYKVENTDYNDAMFSEEISVLPNTPYKVTCKVKVENVQNLNDTKSGGAHISINGSTERSKTISGTSDWQELTFYFNSKNRTKVNVGFRLGGYQEKSKGKAWFSDIKMETGSVSGNTKWKMACFIFPNIDVNVNINGKSEHVKLQMNNNDIANVKANLQRFSSSISQISKNKMTVECETYTILDPITTLSYDEENSYYVSENDVGDYIDSYIKENEYDHIYVAFRMADKQKGNDALLNDWVGLGGMDYFGIGFSNIRMPDDEENYVYNFNYAYNTFPEEVFIHEFLHTLERNAKEYGYEIPNLHDYKQYGYKEEGTEGLKKWYADYMNCNISYNGTKIGLPSQIYSYKPVNKSNFIYSTQVNAFKEPENIIEIIRSLCGRIGKLFTYFSKNENTV